MSARADARSVVLVGMRGVGKSTVGAALAALLRIEFVDLDREIEAAAGATVKRIFAREGEAGFRARESAALRAVARRGRRCVLATGGGIVESPQNGPIASRLGVVVWLQADRETIRRRLARGRGRPSLSGRAVASELRELAARRGPRYRALCDFAVRCRGGSPQTIAARIARRLSAPRR